MKTEKVILTDGEIQLLISALEEKTDRLKDLGLQDISRINNLVTLTHLLQSHL